MKKLFCIGFLLAAMLAHAAPVMVVDSSNVTRTWTVWEDDPTGIDIYVANADDDGDADGNDGNNGLSPEAPVATIVRVKALQTQGRGDRVWFCRGDEWSDGDGSNPEGPTEWYPEGGSSSYPMRYGAYGTGPRPILNQFIRPWIGNIALVSLDCTGYISIFNNPRWNIANFYFEDCYLEPAHINIQGYYREDEDHTYRVQNVDLFRCIIYRNYASSGHVQGMQATKADTINIEQCVFDHNGWHETLGADPTWFSHNIYISADTTGITFRDSITARASATGAQLRSGGICDGNLFLENPLALNFGYMNGDGTALVFEGGVTGTVTNNVIIGDEDICRPRPYEVGGSMTQEQGAGFTFGNILSVDVTGNIIAHVNTAAANNTAISIDADMSDNGITGDYVDIVDLYLGDNVVYEWEMPLELFDGNYTSLVVSGNKFQNATVGAYMVWVEETDNLSGMTFADNVYYTSGTFCYLETGGTNYANWVSASSETGSINTQTSFVAAGRDIPAYMDYLGYDEEDQTVAKFLELARANSIVSYDSRFTAIAARNWIAAGYEVSE